MEEIDFTSGSQTTEEERTGFTIDKCILKVCIVFFRISCNFFDTYLIVFVCLAVKKKLL